MKTAQLHIGYNRYVNGNIAILINGRIIHDTPKANLIELNKGKTIWIPKTVMMANSEYSYLIEEWWWNKCGR